MEFKYGNVLLITQDGKLVDQARITRVEETGTRRILHVVSHLRTENKEYTIEEMSDDETWGVFFLDPLEVRGPPSRFDYLHPVALEVVR